MNHPEALIELASKGIRETYAGYMLSYAYNNGWCRKLGVTVEYSDPFGYTIYT